MGFRIVENAPELYLEKYDEFVEMYNDGVFVKEIRKQLGWGIKDYNKARHRALNNNDIRDRGRGWSSQR